MSSGSEDVSPTPMKAKDTLSWLTDPRKAHQASPRDSFMSMNSTDLYNPSEIGEAVELSVVKEQRGENGPVRQMYVEKNVNSVDEKVNPAIEDDEESVFSSSTVHLGRLNTVKNIDRPQNLPEVTISTSIDTVIPPRLRRRPVSEMISTLQYPKLGKPNHHHRFSLSINDDLDKLMETASVLTEPPSPSVTSRNEKAHSRTSTVNDSIEKESFQTADDLSLGEKSKPLALPKRPNPQNLKRVKQNSASYAQKTENHPEVGDAQSALYSPDQQSTRTLLESNKHESHVTVTQESRPYEEAAAKTPILRDDASTSEEYPTPLVARGSSIGSLHFQLEQGKQSGNQEVPVLRLNSDSTADGWAKLDVSDVSDVLGEPRLQKSPAEFIEKGKLTHSAVTSESQMSSQRLSPTPRYVDNNRLRHASQVLSKSAKKPQSPEISGPVKNLFPNAGLNIDLPERKVSSVENKQMRGDVDQLSVDDDGFYDIEEPVVITHPARAKSVKDNIRGPSRKGSRRKSRRMQKRESETGIGLKPFSYNTLVHLLESMNGTVIGEEFELLNLPVQEKQLVEKVIDSLSRLTLDMVLDNNRYAIGLERLEKAHRVLEGFL